MNSIDNGGLLTVSPSNTFSGSSFDFCVLSSKSYNILNRAACAQLILALTVPFS